MIKKFFKGFTLAEVLITLGIIGVVASMTIPTLVNNHQKQQYVSMLKKQYQALLTVFNDLAAERGSYGNLALSGMFDSASEVAQTESSLASKFKLSKDCGYVSGCFSPAYFETYEGGASVENFFETSNTYRKFITADGVSYAVQAYATSCKTVMGTGKLDKTCARIFIDLNGPKTPNRWGRDIFGLFITNLNGISIIPYGGEGSVNTWKTAGGGAQACGVGTSKHGVFCGGRVLEESWQMNY